MKRCKHCNQPVKGDGHAKAEITHMKCSMKSLEKVRKAQRERLNKRSN